MKAIIFAAGLGTRLRPLTNAIPKAMVPLKKKPLLHHAIDYLSSYGFDDIIINVHHFSAKVKDYIANNHFDAKITISDESEKILDTGGGLKKASWFFDDGAPFLVYNCDVITNLDLESFYSFHRKHKPMASLAVRDRHNGRYLLFDDQMNLKGLGNNKTGYVDTFNGWQGKGREFGFSGIHVIDPKIFDYFPDEDVFSILTLYKRATAANEKIKGFNHSQNFWMDLGKPENLAAAEGIYDQVFK